MLFLEIVIITKKTYVVTWTVDSAKNNARYPGLPKSNSFKFTFIFFIFSKFFLLLEFLCGYLIFNGQQVFMKTQKKTPIWTTQRRIDRVASTAQFSARMWSLVRRSGHIMHKYYILVACVFLR